MDFLIKIFESFFEILMSRTFSVIHTCEWKKITVVYSPLIDVHIPGIQYLEEFSNLTGNLHY